MADPLILVHGPMMDARVFLPQILALSDVAPVHLPRLSRIDAVATMAEDVLSEAPKSFAICGHGTGGMVAMEVLRRAPERVTRIALIATDPLGESAQAASEREAFAVLARAGRLDHVLDRDPAISAYTRNPETADLAEMLRDMARGRGGDGYSSHVRALQRRPDQQRTLRTARHRCLILSGSVDPVWAARRHAFMAGLMQSADLITLDGVGHLPMLEEPDQVNAALRDWLGAPLMLTRKVS